MAVDLSGWSVQYSGATSGSWQKTNLSGSLAPGHYYLVREGAGSGGTTDLPLPDATDNISMAAAAGKVALVSNVQTLGGACPTGGGIVDFLGYGSTANCFEGSGRAPAPGNNSTAVLRNSEGCTDTGNNAFDFSNGAANPRNSSSPAHVCPGSTSLGFETKFLNFLLDTRSFCNFWLPASVHQTGWIFRSL